MNMSYGQVIAQFDYVDLHSTCQVMISKPATHSRKTFSMQYLMASIAFEFLNRGSRCKAHGKTENVRVFPYALSPMSCALPP